VGYNAAAAGEANGKEPAPGSGSSPKGPKTLFEWAIGKKERNGENGEAETGEDRLASDRPDFTEASSTVGRGRIQLEMGYTFIRDRDNGSSFTGHSYPEALFRIGLFADWFELRIGQNFGNERTTGGPVGRADIAPIFHAIGEREAGSFSGADDLYLGVKLWLTEQKGSLPEMALVFQTTVPTGADAFTARQMLPGINLLCGWDVIEDLVTLGTGFQVNRHLDGIGHYYVELAPSITAGYKLTQKLNGYTEFFAILPASSVDPDTKPEYYFDGGFQYFVTNDFALDIRAGVGLNRAADDFFAGTGLVYRY
jgi:hypothetical protein